MQLKYTLSRFRYLHQNTDVQNSKWRTQLLFISSFEDNLKKIFVFTLHFYAYYNRKSKQNSLDAFSSTLKITSSRSKGLGLDEVKNEVLSAIANSLAENVSVKNILLNLNIIISTRVIYQVQLVYYKALDYVKPPLWKLFVRTERCEWY